MRESMPATKMDLAREAVIMLFYGIEPRVNENLEDFVRRGRKILEKAAEERYVEESH